jgi:hypothetical protein
VLNSIRLAAAVARVQCYLRTRGLFVPHRLSVHYRGNIWNHAMTDVDGVPRIHLTTNPCTWVDLHANGIDAEEAQKLSRYEIFVFTYLHEIAHCGQLSTGRLSIDHFGANGSLAFSVISWRENPLSFVPDFTVSVAADEINLREDYFNWPWEIDANLFAAEHLFAIRGM